MNATEIQNLLVNSTRSALDGSEISRSNAGQLLINSTLRDHRGPKTIAEFETAIKNSWIENVFSCSAYQGTQQCSESALRKVTGMTHSDIWRGF